MSPPQANTGLGPAPLQTPLLAGSQDQLGTPYQFRDKVDPTSMLASVPWGTWFNALAAAIADALKPHLIEDTHANRLANFPPANYPIGTQFWETDRTVMYVIAVVATVQVWKYQSGTTASTSNTLSDVPSDLGANDGGYQVNNTFFRRTWIWDSVGNQFHYADGVGAGSQVSTSGPAPAGGLWQACDGSSVTTAEDGASLGSRQTSDTRAVGSDNPFVQGGVGGIQQIAVAVTPVTVQSGTGVNAAADLAPNAANGGLPLRVSMAFWMRR